MDSLSHFRTIEECEKMMNGEVIELDEINDLL